MGSPADRALFHGLRARADAVMVGAGTVRTERYGRLIRDPDVRRQRTEAGLPPDPIACIVSGRLDLPVDLPLLQDPASTVVVATNSDTNLPDVPAAIEYLRGSPLRLDAVLEQLRADHGVSTVLCEGGPTLNGHLFAEGVVDELFLSVSPMITSGWAVPTIVTGEPLEERIGLDLTWCVESDGHLFTRWSVRH